MFMEMQEMPQGQALSVEPILANEHIRVASPQAGGDFGGTCVLSFPPVVSEVIAACDNVCRLTLTSPALEYNRSMLSMFFTVLIRCLRAPL